jgi:hypothetical protein
MVVCGWLLGDYRELPLRADEQQSAQQQRGQRSGDAPQPRPIKHGAHCVSDWDLA